MQLYIILPVYITNIQDIKEYIRRAKAWMNREWGRSKTGKPKSYLMSLLVVRAYENAQRQGSVDPHRYAQVVVYCVYYNNNCAVYNTSEFIS